jgi:hypothetical protein
VFAEWIPETLKEIEKLELLPEPPSPLTITRARKAIVNESARRSKPSVRALHRTDGVAIEIQWGDGRMMVYAGREALLITDQPEQSIL